MSWNGLDDFLTRVSDRLDPPHGEGRLTEYGDLDFLTPEELAVIRPAAKSPPPCARLRKKSA
jgi:hypothetical protein